MASGEGIRTNAPFPCRVSISPLSRRSCSALTDGRADTRRSAWAADGMSAMGAVYRHTTTAMEARIIQALDTRLAEAVAVVEASG